MSRNPDAPTDRIYELLTDKGPMTVPQIVEALQIRDGTARNCVVGLVKRGDVERVDLIRQKNGHGGLMGVYGALDVPRRPKTDVAGIVAAALAARTDLELAWT